MIFINFGPINLVNFFSILFLAIFLFNSFFYRKMPHNKQPTIFSFTFKAFRSKRNFSIRNFARSTKWCNWKWHFSRFVNSICLMENKFRGKLFVNFFKTFSSFNFLAHALFGSGKSFELFFKSKEWLWTKSYVTIQVDSLIKCIVLMLSVKGVWKHR